MRDDAPQKSGEGIKGEVLWKEIHFEELMAKTLSAFEVLENFTYLHHDYCHLFVPFVTIWVVAALHGPCSHQGGGRNGALAGFEKLLLFINEIIF